MRQRVFSLGVVLSFAICFAALASGQDRGAPPADLNRQFQNAVAEYNAGKLPEAAAHLEALLPYAERSYELHELLGGPGEFALIDVREPRVTAEQGSILLAVSVPRHDKIAEAGQWYSDRSPDRCRSVVEGKAYLIGEQISKAENQAAVSGACGLKIQNDLNDLVDQAARSSTTPHISANIDPPLFFSIATQGPIHELWVHWTVVEDGVRMFESKLLDSCNALMLDRVEDFVVKLNNVGNWGTGAFVKSVVERLGKVAVKAAA